MENKKSRGYSFAMRVDRALAGGFLKQIGWLSTLTLCIFTVVVISVASIMHSRETTPQVEKTETTATEQVQPNEPTQQNFWDNAHIVALHFMDAGYLLEDREGYSSKIQLFLSITSLLGMFLFGGLLISTLSNIIERRVSLRIDGRIYYESMQEHYVIIGFGEIIFSVINDIVKQEAGNKHLKIVIMTSQDVPMVRSKVLSHFPSEVDNKIFFYAGDIESREHLSNLNLDKAKKVYLLGEMNEYGRDTKNLEAVEKICDLRGCNKGDILDVHVQFDRLTSYSIIQRLSLPNSYTHAKASVEPTIFFRPFNFYENIARQLWGFTGDNGDMKYDRLDFEEVTGSKYVHLIIVGFNRMGRALLFEALRQCHYPNFDEASGKNKSRITIIDKEMDDIKSTFLAEYPYLDQIRDIEIEYINGRVEDSVSRDIIKCAATTDNSLTTIAICLQDSDYSLSSGLSLPQEVYYKIGSRVELKEGKEQIVHYAAPASTRVLIRQELQDGMRSVFENDTKRFKNVRTFGMLNTGVTSELLNDNMAMCVGAYFDMQYPSADKQAIKDEYDSYIARITAKNEALNDRTFVDWLLDKTHRAKMMQFAKRLWLLTSEDFRFANRYQTDMYANYVRYSKSDKLAQIEHLRWNADRSIIGYRDTSSIGLKDTDYQLHKLIIPCSQLDMKKEEVQKDRDVIDNMHKLFNVFGIETDKLGKFNVEDTH